MDYLKVKNWEKFQHYKDRNPPWIKLHFEILSSPDWVMLADASKLLAVVCMLIASRNEGSVPADPNYLKRVAYLDKVPDFKPLIDCGFLEIPLALASISKHKQATARPETETYRTETEKERRPPNPQGGKVTPLFILPTWVPREEWEGWMEIRKAKKVKSTDRALKLAVGVLQKLKDAGNEPVEVLNQSILRGYTGLFEVKNNITNKKSLVGRDDPFGGGYS